jgi:hypothetical protein
MPVHQKASKEEPVPTTNRCGERGNTLADNAQAELEPEYSDQGARGQVFNDKIMTKKKKKKKKTKTKTHFWIGRAELRCVLLRTLTTLVVGSGMGTHATSILRGDPPEDQTTACVRWLVGQLHTFYG